MEAVSTSETPVKLYQTTQRHIPDESTVYSISSLSEIMTFKFYNVVLNLFIFFEEFLADALWLL